VQRDIQPQDRSQTTPAPNPFPAANGAPAGNTPELPIAPGVPVATGTVKTEGFTEKQTFWGNFTRMLSTNPKMAIGFYIVGFFVLMALIGPFLTHQSPTTFTDDLFQAPSATHWLGTTEKGEDIFAQLVNGARISLFISFAAATGATLLSIFFGLTAGYFGGAVDDILSLLTNVFLVLPGLPLAVVIASFAPFKGPAMVIFVLLITSWPWGARVLRSQTLSMRGRDFVEAARSVGENPWRIVFAEILPNEIAIVASGFVGTFVYAALTEVALEFLGLSDVSIPSWGVILFWAKAQNALLTGGWWMFVPPGLCVAVLCAGLTFINYGIDELANPRLRKDRSRKKAKKVVA
jgi:peptide/nickel transport system permease protein